MALAAERGAIRQIRSPRGTSAADRTSAVRPRRQVQHESVQRTARLDRHSAERGRRACARPDRDLARGSSRGLATLAVCVARRHRARPASRRRSSAPTSPPRSSTALLRRAASPPPWSALLAVAGAVASPAWNMNVGDAEQFVRIWRDRRSGRCSRSLGAWFRTRARRALRAPAPARLRSARSPTARCRSPRRCARVTEVIVPAFADICMVDAIHDGRVDADRGPGATAASDAAAGRGGDAPPRADAARVAGRGSSARGATSRAGGRGCADEELRRMATSPEDLEFLRSLGLRSSIVAPIRARDRNLGALTLLVGLVGPPLRRRRRALRPDPRRAGSGSRSTTPACSPTSRASSGGWTR